MSASSLADLHQHVLWGLDDGPQTPQQMHELLAQDAAQGVTLVYATAHAEFDGRPLDIPLYRERLAEANAYCAQQHLPVTLLSGSEIRYTPAVPDALTRGALLPLGNSRHVLVEFPPAVPLKTIQQAADCLYRAGYIPVLAHAERYRCLRYFPARAIRLREEYGLLYQMNCSAFLHPRSASVRRFAQRMLDARAVDAIGSDAHSAARRPVRLRQTVDALLPRIGEEQTAALTALARQLARREGGDPA